MHFAVKLIEQVGSLFTQSIDQSIQTTTVCHTDNNFFGTVGTAALNQLIHQRNQAFATFKTKAFHARITGTKIFLQTFSSGETFEQM